MKIYNIDAFSNYIKINLNKFSLHFSILDYPLRLSKGILLSDHINWRLNIRIDDIKFIPYTKEEKKIFLTHLHKIEKEVQKYES
jgi:hypothetical protein